MLLIWLRTSMVGMFAGAMVMALIATVSGDPVSIEITPRYLGALLYLAIFGSVVAFGCYLTLIHRIGADKGPMQQWRFRLLRC